MKSDPKSARPEGNEPRAVTESGIPPDRVSHVPSTRVIQLAEVPAIWLDRMIVASLDLPVGASDETIVRALVDALASILTRCAIGVRIAGDAPGTTRLLLRRYPGGQDAPREVPVHPQDGRIFPALPHERVVEVVAGSISLHAASDDPQLEDERSASSHLLDRAALLLARTLEGSRALASMRAQVDALESHAIQAHKLAAFGEIAAGIVHELNNPLTSIVAYTDFLLRRSATAGATFEAGDVERLRRISESAGRMLRFTRDLVSYARPSSAVRVPVVLHGVIEQALAFCEHVITDAKVEVVRRYGDRVPTVRGVPEQLAQIFVNLVTNACHALRQADDRDAQIVITTSLGDEDASVVVIVEDNGHGIPPEHLDQVFLPFFTTKGREGTGLGLSICKSIIDNHDGEISVTSGDKGTRFVVRLPVEER